VPLIGFAGAPFTMATYLVEGGGSKSFAAIKGMLFSSPATAERLLATCAATVASYLAEQVRAGAQAAMLFDTWAGLLGPDDVRRFVLPHVRRVFEDVRRVTGEMGARVPLIYYAGEAAGWLEACRDTGADVIGIDWRVDIGAARARLGPGFAVQGNLDPAILLGTPSLIRARTRSVLWGAAGAADDVGKPPGAARGHVFNLGHGILPQTPPEHARLLVEAVRELTEAP
jgi:uroporphyrinogen decarboxylase